MAENWAIIVAAGKASRFGEDKILKPLNGRPLISWTLDPFLLSSLIDAIVLVLRPEHLSLPFFESLPPKVKKIVPGGEKRSQSVLCGLNAIEDAQFVLIHDGARPCLTVSLIESVLQELKSFPVVTPVLPVKETIKVCSEEMTISKTIGKDFWVAQTPQGFHFRLLKDAYKRYPNPDFPDDCLPCELTGAVVKAIPGQESNIKVTSPNDFHLAEIILKERANESWNWS